MIYWKIVLLYIFTFLKMKLSFWSSDCIGDGNGVESTRKGWSSRI